jgi:hypothetical protein
VIGLHLQEVLDRQRQRLLAVLEPVQDLTAQASRSSLLLELVTSGQKVATVGSATLKALWASHSNRPVDRDGYCLAIIVVEV